MAPPPPPPRPAAAGPIRVIGPATAARKRAAEAPPPPKWRVPAASIAISLEVLLLCACLMRAGILLSRQGHADSLAQAQKQAERIREAWAELADRGALLRARLDKSTGKFDELQKHVVKAAADAGLKPEYHGPTQIKSTKSMKVTRLIVRARGTERQVLKFLLMLDRAPTVVETENLELTGQPKGILALKLSLLHYEYSPAILKEMKEFVAKLPSVSGTYEHRSSRGEKLFVPHLVVDESALRGWPKVTLNGFSEDKALMMVGNESKTFAQGETVAEGVIYAEKLSVNQAVLRRLRDNAEIIVTIGSRSYSLRPSEVRGMSEFVLTLQKRAPADLPPASNQ